MPDPDPSVRDVLGLQAREWAAGRGARLAGYLERFPALHRHPQVLLDLVIREVVLREQAGERPGVGEYVALLPALADDLRLLFAVDGLLKPGADTAAGPTGPPHGRVVGELAAHALLPPDRLRAAESLAPGASAAGLVGELVGRGWLTPFQAGLVLAGRAGELVLGDYVLLDRLGAGGMGEVFKARDRQLDRVAAVKVIRPAALSGSALGRFAREARAVARLAHPNVVAVYGADVSGPRPFLAMEFVAGDPLDRWVAAAGPLPPADGLEVVRQAALGLGHAHGNGIVHRDVKPGNMIRAAAPGGAVVKVLDFGLAGLRAAGGEPDAGSPLTDTGAVFGTPDYMAPEQFRDSGRADHRADVYALGCTLFFLLTGRPPFPGGSYWDKRAGHERGTPPPVPGLDPPAARLLGRMMAKDPADRFPSAAAVAAAVAETSRESVATVDGGREPTVPDFPAPVRHVRPAPARRRWPIAAAAGGLVLIAVVVTVVAWPRGPTGRPTGPQAGQGPDADPPVPETGRPLPPPLAAPVDKARSILRQFNPTKTHGPIYRAAFSPDGREVVTDGEDGRVRVWDIVAGNPTKPVRTLGEKKGPVWFCGFLPGGKSFLVGCPDGCLRVWAWPDGALIRGPDSRQSWKPAWVAAADPAGRRAVSGERDGEGVFRVWDLGSRAEVGPLPGPPGEAHAVAVSADGTRALTAAGGKLTRALTPAGGTLDVLYWDLTDRRLLRPLAGHTAPVWAVAFSPDERFALTGGNDATLRLWRLADAKEVGRADVPGKNYLLCAAVLPGGTRAVTGDGAGGMRVWELPSPWDAPGGQIRPVKDLPGHKNSVYAINLDASGTRAVSTDADGTVIVWDLSP
jgi:WD40 repeat protein